MKLVFVYNVNSDPLSLILDGAHKVFSPSTYDCDLCEITYSNLGERKVWKEYRKSSKVEFEFIYKNQMNKRYGDLAQCPAILQEHSADELPTVLVSREELAEVKIPAELIALIQRKLD